VWRNEQADSRFGVFVASGAICWNSVANGGVQEYITKQVGEPPAPPREIVRLQS
jgi:hypothetical protein